MRNSRKVLAMVVIALSAVTIHVAPAAEQSSIFIGDASVKTAPIWPGEKAYDGLYKKLRFGVYNNLTDDDLSYTVRDSGAALKILLDQRNTRRSRITLREYNSIAMFSPADAQSAVEDVTALWFISQPLPWGAPSTTWASQSLLRVDEAILAWELCKKSVVVKLLRDNGYVQIPESINAYFTWSHIPDVIIPLPPPQWSRADRPVLRRLLKNPEYAAMARARLDLINHPSS